MTTQGIGTRAPGSVQSAASSRIQYSSVQNRVQYSNKAAENRVQANHEVTNRVVQDAIGNRVQPNSPAGGQVDIAA